MKCKDVWVVCVVSVTPGEQIKKDLVFTVGNGTVKEKKNSTPNHMVLCFLSPCEERKS